MSDKKRNEIKKKVAAAESRNKARSRPTMVEQAGEKAIEAKDKFTAFAREHPVAVIAGGLALGVVISGLFRGSPTRKAGRAVGNKLASLASIGADLAVTYALQAYNASEDARRAASEKLGELGDSLGDRARELGDDAADYASNATAAARETGKSIGRSVRNRIH